MSIEKIDEAIKHLEEEEDINITNFRHKDPAGLGDTLERVLSSFGITEESVSQALGGRGCGCSKRKQFLNKIFPYRNKKED